VVVVAVQFCGECGSSAGTAAVDEEVVWPCRC
jgi:hypothetical protein